MFLVSWNQRHAIQTKSYLFEADWKPLIGIHPCFSIEYLAFILMNVIFIDLHGWIVMTGVGILIKHVTSRILGTALVDGCRDGMNRILYQTDRDSCYGLSFGRGEFFLVKENVTRFDASSVGRQRGIESRQTVAQFQRSK